jgi:hypothetical protein
MENARRSRPALCPCPNSCMPIYNGLAFDERVKTGDLNEGYSGDCIGKGDESVYIVGGETHTNDMNHCVFTPLKGIVRFQINEGDVDAMLQMCQAVLHALKPERKCEACGTSQRWTHWIRTGDGRLFCCTCYHQGKGGASGQTEL